MAAVGQPAGTGTVVEIHHRKRKRMESRPGQENFACGRLSPEQYDAEYYVTHQLIPVVSNIFTILGYSEEKELLFKEAD